MSELINQSTAKPTRKVTFSALGALLGYFVTHLVTSALSGSAPDEMVAAAAAEVSALTLQVVADGVGAVLGSFGLGYLVRDRSE